MLSWLSFGPYCSSCLWYHPMWHSTKGTLDFLLWLYALASFFLYAWEYPGGHWWRKGRGDCCYHCPCNILQHQICSPTIWASEDLLLTFNSFGLCLMFMETGVLILVNDWSRWMVKFFHPFAWKTQNENFPSTLFIHK